MISSARRFVLLGALCATAAREAPAQTIQTLTVTFSRDPPVPFDVPLSSALTIAIIAIVGVVGGICAKRGAWRLISPRLVLLIAIGVLSSHSGQSWAPPKPGLQDMNLVLFTSPKTVPLPVLPLPTYGYAVTIANGTDFTVKLLAVGLDAGTYHIDLAAGSGFGTPCQIGQLLAPGATCAFAAQSQFP